MTYTIEQIDIPELEAVVWFQQLDELRNVGPGEVSGSDFWAAKEGDEIIALALVDPTYAMKEDAHVFRIGVLPAYRRQGIAQDLLDEVAREYGTLELECRESLDANEFYKATGWEKTGVSFGDPEDLVQWRYER